MRFRVFRDDGLLWVVSVKPTDEGEFVPLTPFKSHVWSAPSTMFFTRMNVVPAVLAVCVSPFMIVSVAAEFALLAEPAIVANAVKVSDETVPLTSRFVLRT